MYHRLEQFLTPLRDTNWSSWPCQPVGLLAQSPSFGRRHSMVPPEAIPILNLGVDGCHYAVWVDDPRTLNADPGIVLVSPMDSYPEMLRWVAPSVKSFAGLLREDDDWLTRSDPAILRERQQAEDLRATLIAAPTVDGMGVLDQGARHHAETLGDVHLLSERIGVLLEQGAYPDALVVARNAIANQPVKTPGFGSAIASVYSALKRPEYAEVALLSYEPTEEDLQRQAQIGALIAKTLRTSN